MRFTTRTLLTHRVLFAGAIVATMAAALTSCSSDSKLPSLTEEGKAGHTLYLQSGCASCHGTTGGGGAGPALIGLYGTDVELKDGTVVVADDAYLTTSISDPEAQKVAGYSVVMPQRNKLSDEEIAEIVTFIKEIGPSATTDTTTTGDATTPTTGS